jgi:hypothetical protein
MDQNETMRAANMTITTIQYQYHLLTSQSLTVSIPPLIMPGPKEKGFWVPFAMIEYHYGF